MITRGTCRGVNVGVSFFSGYNNENWLLWYVRFVGDFYMLCGVYYYAPLVISLSLLGSFYGAVIVLFMGV